MAFTKLFLATVALAIGAASADDGLKNIKHVVLFMQENRAFDHYFGTMAGIRGFQDPNVHISKNTGKSVFYQPVDHSTKPKPPSDSPDLLPWYINYQGGDWDERSQCMVAGSNDWRNNHAAWNEGEIDRWARNNTPYSVGYYKKSDLPVHFSLAENFVVGDSYYESVISSTKPNRVVWMSGSINTEGSAVGGDNKQLGGPVIDNNENPGCEKTDAGSAMSCNPLRWKTVPEYLQDAGITWQVYQNKDNFGDDPLVSFEKFQKAGKHHSELAQRGTAHIGLERFYEDAEKGTLPAVSFVVAPMQLSEHPPYTPNDGAWLQRKVANAVMHGKAWKNSALIISYDESGGWADHVMSPHASKDTPGEWMTDPYHEKFGLAPTGPGLRLPFYIVSPYTRNGGVFTEHCAHESQILFLEKWSKAHGKEWKTTQMNKWRREQLSDLVNAFDFSNPDYSVPDVPSVPKASKDPLTGDYNGADVCQRRFDKKVQPHVPYGKQSVSDALSVESGYKRVRGDITEGRYLSLENGDHAVQVSDGKLTAGAVSKDRKNTDQLFVVQWLGSEPKDNRFRITDYKQKHYITSDLSLSEDTDNAILFSISDVGNGNGHEVRDTKSGKYLVLNDGHISLSSDRKTFTIYSVTL